MESGAGISLDPVGTVIRLESAVSGDLQYRAADNHHVCICLAGEAHLETAGDPDGIVQPVFPNVPMGFSALMAAVVFFGGMIMIMLGLIGEYVGRIYISMNNSPQYVIREKIHLGEEDR